jgi:hypothetical protein
MGVRMRGERKIKRNGQSRNRERGDEVRARTVFSPLSKDTDIHRACVALL